MSHRFPEFLTGLAVIAVAAAFLVYAMLGAGEINTGGYPLRAQFSSVGGLTVGADVKIAGVVIGHVASEQLDPITYAAIVGLAINKDIKVPQDSSASVTSDGLLGGSYVAVSPGGSDTMLSPGQTFSVTQSAINIQDLLGKFIFSMGNGTPAKAAQASGQAASAPASGPAALK